MKYFLAFLFSGLIIFLFELGKMIYHIYFYGKKFKS